MDKRNIPQIKYVLLPDTVVFYIQDNPFFGVGRSS